MAQINEATHKALASFPVMPDEAYVREPVVRALYGCAHTTLWGWVKTGIIPAPRKISSGFTAWNVGELRRSLAAI